MTIARFFVPVLLFLFALTTTPASAGSVVYYLFRHAEKVADVKDPGLNEEGKARAEYLVRILYQTGVTRILSSDTKRTRDTVATLSDWSEMPIELYDPRDLESFAEQLKNMEGVIVISGHSNTTPELTALLTGQETEPMDASEYDRLYQVIRSGETYIVNTLKQGDDFDEESKIPLTIDQIEQIEATLVMPDGADPVASYFRYYKGVSFGDHSFIIGTFLTNGWVKLSDEGENPPKLQIITNGSLPYVFDGGCFVINFRWDLTTGRLVFLYCNGYA